ncbi:MAG: amino acid ABC transporter permease [Paracoccaceae bacterium]
MNYAWDFSAVWRNIGQLAEGLQGTALLTLACLALALPLGLLLAVMRMSPVRALRLPATLWIDFFRAAPALVLIVWFYFAFPILARVNLDAFGAAFLAIGLQSAAYMAEVFRAGMQAIGRGQWEAGAAIGLTKPATIRYIILPQAVRHMIPVFLIRFAELVKATTLAAVIAYGDMVYRANALSAQTFRPLEVFTATALIFFVVIFSITGLAKLLGGKAAPAR